MSGPRRQAYDVEDDDDAPLPLNTPVLKRVSRKKQQTFVKPSPKKEFERSQSNTFWLPLKLLKPMMSWSTYWTS